MESMSPSAAPAGECSTRGAFHDPNPDKLTGKRTSFPGAGLHDGCQHALALHVRFLTLSSLFGLLLLRHWLAALHDAHNTDRGFHHAISFCRVHAGVILHEQSSQACWSAQSASRVRDLPACAPAHHLAGP